ncbi:unnamed protein product [Closterium sp. NIES-53]
MASLRVLAFDHEGRPVQFDAWLDDLQLYLLSDIKDGVSLFDHVSGAAIAPPTTTDSATRSQWLSCDAAARLAIRNHLPLAECAHFGQHRTSQALYDAVVTRYSFPATATLGRLLLPYLFPELSAFATVEDLVSHLRTSDARYRAAVPAEFLDKNQPPMFITLYFIVTRLPDSLRSVRDHFLSLDPTSLTVDLLDAKRRSGKGKGGGGGSGGGGGGSGSGGGGSSGGGSGGGTGGGSGGSGGGGGGSGGSGGGGGSGTGGGGTGARRVGSGGGQRQQQQRQQQQRQSETQSPRQLREWFLYGAIAIFDLNFDAILSAMYALSVSAEGDCYRCVPPDPSIAAASLGASEFGTLLGTAPARALHNFTLDSGASACFFRDSTTITLLSTPVPVRLADPLQGPGRGPLLHCPPVSDGSVRLTKRSSPPLVICELGEYRYPLGCDGHYNHSWGVESVRTRYRAFSGSCVCSGVRVSFETLRGWGQCGTVPHQEPLGAVSTMAGPEERGGRVAGGSGEAQAQGQPRDSAMAPVQPSLGPPRDEPRVFGLDKFNGDNFAEWSFNMENIFDHYDLLEVMEGTEKRPENDPEKSPWVRKSAQGYLLLGQALGSSQIRHIKPFQREPEKGPKAWAALKGVHAPATEVVAVVLERQMAALRIEEDEAVEEGVQKFFDLLTRLEGADLNYSELQKKTKLLALLPESWSSLIINLNRDLRRLSLEDVKRGVLQEDFHRRQEGRGAGGGRGIGRGGRGGRGGGAASMKSAGNESESRDDRFPGQFFFVSTQAPAVPEKDEGFEEPAAVGKVTLHSLDYWVIDSGATYSMTPRADLLTELEPSPVKHVTSALGQRAAVKGMGKAMFKGADGKMVGLKKVLWVSNLAANLISVRRLQKAGMDTSSKGAKTYTARLGERILWDLHEDRDVYNEMWQIPVVPMPKERQVATSISTKGEAVGSGDGPNGRAMEMKSKKCNPGGTSMLGEHKESGAAAQK